MRSLRTVIVDDEPRAIGRLRLALEGAGTEVVGAATEGGLGLEMIRELRPDVVLLDIKMPNLNGLELAAALTGQHAPALIFVTAYRNFAIEAFQLAAVDYLLKPVAFERLHEAIARARTRLEQSTAAERAAAYERLLQTLQEGGAPLRPPAAGRPLWISDGRSRRRISPDEIEWIEAEREYVRIYAAGKDHLVRRSLASLLEELDDTAFCRVHRSAIVSLSRVRRLVRNAWGGAAVQLESGAEVPVGRSYLAETRARLGVSRGAEDETA